MRALSVHTSYQHLAQVYDVLMAEAPYEQWITFAEKMWDRGGDKPRKILDLGCGTGAIAIPLAQRGYRVTGVDLSEEMLAITYDKAKEKGLQIELLHQDMREVEVAAEMDAVVSFCDSINYLTEGDDVCQTFLRVSQALKPGGLFLFDVHSLYKIYQVFGNSTFTFTEEDVAYIWHCELEEDGKVYHDLTIFAREGQLYRRFEEVHAQRAYSHEQLLNWLREAGFELLQCSADFTDQSPTETSERIFYVAVKK